MNERIQKLYVETTGKDWVYDFDPDYAEKFAELIVRECAEVCRNQPNHYAQKADRDNCAIAIEEHFGVEE